MKIKTSELSGAALDWAVAYALNGERVFFEAFGAGLLGGSIIKAAISGQVRPSTDWSQGGPLIDRFSIELTGLADGSIAANVCSVGVIKYQEGGTRLIAAMRAIVAAKLGDEIEVPEELV